jgi:N-acetylmuramoyl-L-alanine amidase
VETPAKPRQEPKAKKPPAFPELSRHLRGSETVYSPDSSDWLRQPGSRPRSGANTGPEGESGKTPPPKVPPRDRRKPPPKPAPKPSRSSAVRVGGLLLVCIVLLGFGVQQFNADGGTPSPTPTLTPIFQPAVVGTPEGVAVPTETPTLTPVPTETTVPTQTPTPKPTATPDPRFIGKIVCLDPGHGGSDRGATRKARGDAPEMEEAVYTLIWARALKLRLESDGFTVVMTRNEDVDVNTRGKDINGDGETGKNQRDATKAHRARMVDELQSRINFCNKADASVLISMHINYFDDPTAVGYETWFSGARMDADASKLFAGFMQEEIGKQYAEADYNTVARGAFNDNDAEADLGVGTFDHYLMIGPAQQNKVTPSNMPSIIVEVGFLSNDDEAAFMVSPEGRNAIISAYENAITRYFDYVSDHFVYGAK